VLEGVRPVGAEAARRADELDRLGAFPDDLYDDLAATGCLQAMLPRAFGGREFSLAEINELIIEASKANGALGWLLLIGIPLPLVLGLFSVETVSKLVSEYPRVRGRGVIAPKGNAVPTDGGNLVSGRWPFASGGPHPDFVAANCIVMVDGAPKFGPDGAPELMLAMLPAAQVEFLDTWHVLGLRATDSCDFAVHEVFVPQHMTAHLLAATSSFQLAGNLFPR
jgi:alkylation response protein AidB-like acyl-CoA dehydrogenase